MIKAFSNFYELLLPELVLLISVFLCVAVLFFFRGIQRYLLDCAHIASLEVEGKSIAYCEFEETLNYF